MHKKGNKFIIDIEWLDKTVRELLIELANTGLVLTVKKKDEI